MVVCVIFVLMEVPDVGEVGAGGAHLTVGVSLDTNIVLGRPACRVTSTTRATIKKQN